MEFMFKMLQGASKYASEHNLRYQLSENKDIDPFGWIDNEASIIPDELRNQESVEIKLKYA